MALAEGIDVSYAQEHDPDLTGLDFVIVKASEGGGIDPRWAQHSAQVRAQGLPLLAYHFLRAEVSIAGQIATFLNVAAGADGWAVDYEHSGSGSLPSANQVRTFIASWRRQTEQRIGLYQSLRSPRPYPPDSYGADWRWIAYYGTTPPPIRWDFWQYRGIGLDRDRFNGTADDLRAFLGLPVQPPAAGAGDGMTNLVPMTVHRVVDLKAGTTLYDAPNGPKYTTLTADVTLGMLGATMGDQTGFYQVADGDYGVYVERSAATVRTADMNVGA
jgi:hypothetical protein